MLKHYSKIILTGLTIIYFFSYSPNYAQNLFCSTLPTTNFTNALQDSIKSGNWSRIIFDGAAGKIYETDSFRLSNSINEMILEEGVILRALRGAITEAERFITLEDLSNVTIRGEGSGATIEMWIEDYKTGQYRHILALRGSRNITVENLTLARSGGDGLYIGVSWVTRKDCEDITVRNVIFEGNPRQGITVISANGVTIEGCTFRNTGNDPRRPVGLAPEGPYAGIDFEPNHGHERLLNILVSNCVFEHNRGQTHTGAITGYGLDFALHNLTEKSEGISITIDNFNISNSPFGFYFIATTPKLKGSIRFMNGTISNTDTVAMRFRNWPHSPLKLSFDNIVLDNPTQNPNNAAIELRNWNSRYHDGGITMTNIQVTNCLAKRVVRFNGEGNLINKYRDILINYSAEKDYNVQYPGYYDNVSINQVVKTMQEKNSKLKQ